MPDKFDPLMDLDQFQNAGSASGGTTSPGPNASKCPAENHDGKANTGTTTRTRTASAPSTPGTNSAKWPGEVDTFSGDRV